MANDKEVVTDAINNKLAVVKDLNIINKIGYLIVSEGEKITSKKQRVKPRCVKAL
ncbi:MAG: hypothetical protein ACRDCA_00470 [Serratia sp. (in: enterobacteria)]|uniref:hypothetical protein n=1 Tax=Serratia sp. (in: enterobacteria) TaxID=616 RepID=UPI003F3A3200